ncbi:unnamed protein product, partial [Didymodactylos carnosus]
MSLASIPAAVSAD